VFPGGLKPALQICVFPPLLRRVVEPLSIREYDSLLQILIFRRVRIAHQIDASCVAVRGVHHYQLPSFLVRGAHPTNGVHPTSNQP
jgi:hypothetical protein